MKNKIFFMGILLIVTTSIFAQPSARRSQPPANYSREEVIDIIVKVNKFWQDTHPTHGWAFWHPAAYHTGNMEAYAVTGREEFRQYSEEWAKHNEWKGAKSDDKSTWRHTYGERDNFVLFGDWQICFQTYIDLYRLDKSPEEEKEYMIARAKEVMEYQMSTSRNDYWWWADGLYMVMPVMTKLYRITGDNQYLEKLHEYFTFARQLMYDEEAGLFFRDAKYVYPQHKTNNGLKDFWSRGNGWVFAGLAKVLQDLPDTDIGFAELTVHRAEYIQVFKTMAAALKNAQQPEGYWSRSVLDLAHAPGYETSGTAFFTYGFLWGINNGILDRNDYLETVQKAWDYLTQTALQPDGMVGYVQPIGERADQHSNVGPTTSSDFGTGAFLLAASEYTRFLMYGMNLKPVQNDNTTFKLNKPDYKTSPLSGMTRQHWLDAAEYLLDGAFGYIQTMDDPMKFPKHSQKAYPRNAGQLPTEKLEGFCRTLFMGAPLLRENPNLVLNNIKVADYYRHNLLNLINPESPSYIKHRGNGGASQILVEFGALAISLFVIPEILWEPLTKEQQDAVAAMMLSYGDGPTIGNNWRFFNIFILSFFKTQGYEVNETLLVKYLEDALGAYRGNGWYHDSPAYDYYSMWAYQMYGAVWSQLYGNKYQPELAAKFMKNLSETVDNYPYMFSKDGKMNMWGRSMPYRFGSVIPLALTGFLNDPNINYGWLRRIASSTMLQFLEHPDFLEDRVPTLGFYGPFEPAVQIYSCRGSVYWMGKAFLALLLPKDNVFWTAKENNGPWEKELKKNNVYNKFQEGSNLLITNYPNSGASEMRSWCHATVAGDWQLFRSSENYNKLAYNTAFPWMADGKNGEISMNYGVVNGKNEWEVLRLYTFIDFKDGIYRRDAELETNPNIKFKLADIPLPNGVLRVDKVIFPVKTQVLLGHYSLPELQRAIQREVKTVKVEKPAPALILNNGEYQLAMISLEGWKETKFVDAQNLHPVSPKSSVIVAEDTLEGEKIFITLQLWKQGTKAFSQDELTPVKKIEIANDKTTVKISLKDGSVKTVHF